MKKLKAHQQERAPATPPIERRKCQNGARGQGFAPPRQKARPCQLRAVRQSTYAMGGSGGNTYTV